MKADVKVGTWSRMRGLDRTVPGLTIRFSPIERRAIETEAAARLARPSDIIRASLIYAGVIETPPESDTTEE